MSYSTRSLCNIDEESPSENDTPAENTLSVNKVPVKDSINGSEHESFNAFTMTYSTQSRDKDVKSLPSLPSTQDNEDSFNEFSMTYTTERTP